VPHLRCSFRSPVIVLSASAAGLTFGRRASGPRRMETPGDSCVIPGCSEGANLIYGSRSVSE
jgi:hypothetical protein